MYSMWSFFLSLRVEINWRTSPCGLFVCHLDGFFVCGRLSVRLVAFFSTDVVLHSGWVPFDSPSLLASELLWGFAGIVGAVQVVASSLDHNTFFFEKRESQGSCWFSLRSLIFFFCLVLFFFGFLEEKDIKNANLYKFVVHDVAWSV